MVNPVSTLKERHRREAYELLARRREVSRAEVARELSVSIQTAIKIMRYFEDYGFARYIGEGEAAKGRRPQIYALNADAAHIVGIVHEGSVIHAGVVNLAYETIAETSADMSDDITEVIAEQTCGLSETMLERLKAEGRAAPRLVGVGIGLPGVVDDIRNELSYAPSLSIQTKYELGALIETAQARLNAPVTIENDVNAAVYGEYGGEGDLAFLSVGSGVGMGLVIDGKPRRGKRFMAGEVGELRLFDGEAGIEALIGLNALRRRWGFERRFGLHAMPEAAQAEMLDAIADAAARVIDCTARVVDVSDFVVGGLTLGMMGDALFERIERKARACCDARVRRQNLPCPALTGVCKKMLDLRLNELLSLDS